MINLATFFQKCIVCSNILSTYGLDFQGRDTLKVSSAIVMSPLLFENLRFEL